MFKIPDSVSTHENVYDVLKERGFIEQTTDDDGIRELLGREKVKFYIGFDATANCLHVGHFMQVIIMMYMQKYGHTPVVLIGGGTTMIGDPSGRSDARKMMTTAEIDENCHCFKTLFDRFIKFDEGWSYIPPKGGALGRGGQNREPKEGFAIAVNNADWLRDLNYLEFMRDVGKNFSVNEMLRAECFKQRMEKGLSFFEFNYMLLQAYDFYRLACDINCKIQFGGNDQWSNILAGRDLARRILGKDNYYGMTFSLLTKADGTKMGKSLGGALWLDEQRCSPYDFYQYWRNVDDGDVEKCLRMLTFLPMDEVERLGKLKDEEANIAKEILAFEVTKLVHGEEKAASAQSAARAMFSGSGDDAAMPTKVFKKSDFEEGFGLAALMRECGLVKSNSEAFRAIEQGGVKMGGKKILSRSVKAGLGDFSDDGTLIIQKGKKTYVKVVIK